MNGLEVIEPAATPVEFNGRALEIKPLTVGQLPAFARAIKPISASVERIAVGGVLTIESMIDLIADAGDNVIDAVSIASGVAADELRSTTPDQLLILAAAAWGVNRDFLSGRLTPSIQAAMKAATGTPGAGQTP